MNRKKIGWVGVGAMGSAMARRLANAGHSLIICGSGRRDLSGYAVGIGADLASSPKDIISEADVLFFMIPDGKVLLEIVQSNTGIAQADLTGKIIIDMSTVDADSSAKANAIIEQRGGKFLRAPVTGSTHYAEKGTLGIMVSGNKDIYERCLSYLQILGNRVTYLGPGEEARYIKIIINMMLGHILQSFSEALVLGETLGLDWEIMIDLISDSAAASPIIQYKSPAIKARDFTPTSTGYNMHKDMKLASALAQKFDLCLPLTAATQQMYNALISMGMQDKDSTSIILVNEYMSALNSETDKK